MAIISSHAHIGDLRRAVLRRIPDTREHHPVAGKRTSQPAPLLHGAAEPPLGFSNGKKQAHWAAGERPEAKVRIEPHSRLILGIDDQREYRRFCAHGPHDCVHDQRRAKAPPLVRRRDRQAADQCRRQQRIAWQASRFVSRQFRRRQAGRREGVVAGNRARGIDGNEAVRHPPPNVLRHLLPEIPVEGGHAAREAAPVVVAQRLDDIRPRHREAAITLWWRLTARSMAGVSSGGLRMASAKAR